MLFTVPSTGRSQRKPYSSLVLKFLQKNPRNKKARVHFVERKMRNTRQKLEFIPRTSAKNSVQESVVSLLIITVFVKQSRIVIFLQVDEAGCEAYQDQLPHRHQVQPSGESILNPGTTRYQCSRRATVPQK